MALVEQVRLFTNASLVVAGHDGALTNLLFCRPFTTVVEITPYVGQAEAPIQHLRAMFQAAAGSMAAAAYEVRHFSVPGAACDWGCASQRAMLRLVESPWPNERRRNAHKQPKMRKI
uniref:Glycosyltransferase 61 catalytic domain-containing protein n=1 Tax=Emiliania huxleyi TaxID=2903 RepID=A0A7S3W232_EMIHU